MIKLVEGVAVGNKALKGLVVRVTVQQGKTVNGKFERVRDALLDWHLTMMDRKRRRKEFVSRRIRERRE